MRRITRIATLLLLAFLPALAISAQTAEEETAEIIDVDVENYLENGETQLVVEFRNMDSLVDLSGVLVFANGEPVGEINVDRIGRETVPVSMVLAIDVSGSMSGAPIEAAKRAATQFVNSMRATDFITIVTFSDTVTALGGGQFTSNKGTLRELIASIEAVPSGGTAMYDGVIEGVDRFVGGSGTGRKNLIVLTDGADQHSTATLEEAIAAVEGSGVRVFGVALQSTEFSPDALKAITEAGDGMFLSTTDPAALEGLYGQIQTELANAVVVTFNSPVQQPGDVEFEVWYNDIRTGVTVPVSGYTVATTSTTTTTTTTLPAGDSWVVDSNMPFDYKTMILVVGIGVGAAVILFVFILLGPMVDKEGPTFASRLQVYGRKGGGGPKEHRSFIERIPLLRLFTERAEEVVKKRGLLGAVNSALEQANIPLSAGESIAAALGLAGVMGLVVWIVSGSAMQAATILSIIVFLIFGTINFLGSREQKKFERQLPDTLTLVSTSLRAGYSLLQAVEAVAQEAPDPTAREFQRAVVEARLGVPVTQALNGITDRTKSKDFEWAVLAIEIQREVGGNLSEVLQTVADTMLARNRLKGEIRALTAEGRISAYVLGALPILLLLFLNSTNPQYLAPLVELTIGKLMLGAGAFLMLLGALWLRKLVNIEV